jgi:hypothetical protein
MISTLLGSWQLKVAVLLLAFLAGWQINGWRLAAEKAAAEEARQAMIDAFREEEAKSAAMLEKRLKELRANEKVIERERIKLVDRPVYNNECLDNDGVQLVERARTGKSNSSKSNGEVSGTK